MAHFSLRLSETEPPKVERREEPDWNYLHDLNIQGSSEIWGIRIQISVRIQLVLG